MYFPQGHEAYLRTFPENQAPPYKFFKGQPAVVKCQVDHPLAYREDSFAPPPAEEGAGSGEAHSKTFSVSLRDCGEADFLVSERRYNESVGRNWRLSERVMMEWMEQGEDGEEGEGVLTPYFGVASSRNDWPNSPWDCLSIRWDFDNTTSSLGPWEPRPVSRVRIVRLFLVSFGVAF
ncbi:unnamed protein product [Ectocarpus fasciculatus]